MKIKKVFIIICIVSVIFSFSMTCYASTELVLNHGVVEFNELMLVENGITYIPLRLAFNLNASPSNPGLNPSYGINVKDFIDDSYVEVSLRRKDFNGDLINEGRYIRIEWADNIKNANADWANGRLTCIKYNVINDNNEAMQNGFSYHGLDANIKLIPVSETGDRLFMSLEDIEKIVDFLTDGGNYQVDIITE